MRMARVAGMLAAEAQPEFPQMTLPSESWDYFVVTASNDAQAATYESQLALRREFGMLAGVRNVLVVADPGGKRVGSGGSTICCLAEIAAREQAARPAGATGLAAWESIFQRLRILILHAGGDSRRLPAYGSCGKLFIPVPGESDGALPTTLFDRQIPIYLALPPMGEGVGQVVVAAGDVLVRFDPQAVRFAPDGWTGLGCLSTPEQASGHGVYCCEPDGQVRLFLQKPSPAEQRRHGAVDRFGQSMLDVGLFAFDGRCAAALLEMCSVQPAGDGRLGWSGEVGQAIETHGMDLYREIACAMGSEAGLDHLVSAARAADSKWPETLLAGIHRALSGTSLSVRAPRST